jgi:hypothetical protein
MLAIVLAFRYGRVYTQSGPSHSIHYLSNTLNHVLFESLAIMHSKIHSRLLGNVSSENKRT